MRVYVCVKGAGLFFFVCVLFLLFLNTTPEAGFGERPAGFAVAVRGFRLCATPAQVLLVAGLVHWPVGARVAPLLELFEEGLVAALEQVHLGPVQRRVIVLVVVAVLVAQVARSATHTQWPRSGPRARTIATIPKMRRAPT